MRRYANYGFVSGKVTGIRVEVRAYLDIIWTYSFFGLEGPEMKMFDLAAHNGRYMLAIWIETACLDAELVHWSLNHAHWT
jgi:hypothetical protein